MSESPKSPMPAPRFAAPPPFASFLVPALLWGLVASLMVTAAFTTLIALVRMLHGSDVDFVGLTSGALIWTALLFLFLGGLRILSYSRPWQDKAFTVTGFCATFFGLGMLVIFFVGIVEDVALWFKYIPRLIEKQNQETLQAREDLKDVEANLKKVTENFDAEYAREVADRGPKFLNALRQAQDKHPQIKELIATIEARAKDAEEFKKSLPPLLKDYQSEVKKAAPQYAQLLSQKAKDYQGLLDRLAKSVTQDDARAAVKELQADFQGKGESYAGAGKFLTDYQKLDSVTNGPVVQKLVDQAKTLLVEIKNLHQQNNGNDGVYRPEQYYREALAAAPNAAIRKSLEAIRAQQRKYDGKDGIFITKEEADRVEAVIVALTKAAVGEEDEKLANAVQDAYAGREGVKTAFEGFEGFGGVYELMGLADFQQTYFEKKKVADLPLRDPSAWAAFWHFMLQTPSNTPQDAGIWPALLGSFWIALITIVFAVPVGVGAALYLEEYKHGGWLGHLIQVNINNLAGVPSVVYSILGAFIFVDLIFRPLAQGSTTISPRNVIGGGLTLGLLTLPIVIVSAQEAIKAVPNSIRQGAYALGATHWQVIWRQVLPLARPGILTGTILAVSRAIGEAAPLVLFGALQFVDVTPGPFSGFTVMPMQIYNWAERPLVDVPGETDKLPVWHYNAALASLLLLIMLLMLNALAIWMRNRAQKRMRL